jgi:two-component system chemotaxis response regulator CheB/chemosensory pili system protein ChpB (putative protein-glutamate methylesterase)
VAGDHARIALLCGARESSALLREALNAIGVPIVYEVPAAAFKRDALERSGANVVVIDLDAQDDPVRDGVYDLIDDTRYRVIINDGSVSGGLAGWDRARWQRHLASKILGVTDVYPPRPVDAEPVPQRTASIKVELVHLDDAKPAADTEAAEPPAKSDSAADGALEAPLSESAIDSKTKDADGEAPMDWALEDISFETPTATAEEKSDLEELLAPKTTAQAPASASAGSGLTLELVPLEELSDATSVEDESANRETWFDQEVQTKAQQTKEPERRQ